MTWAGRKVATARAHWKTRLPLPCYLCGRPVAPGHRWVVEHITPRSMGGTDQLSNQWVSHRICSDRQGQRLQPKTKRKVSTPRLEPESARGIRGI